jgi:hypothetical protein
MFTLKNSDILAITRECFMNIAQLMIPHPPNINATNNTIHVMNRTTGKLSILTFPTEFYTLDDFNIKIMEQLNDDSFLYFELVDGLIVQRSSLFYTVLWPQHSPRTLLGFSLDEVTRDGSIGAERCSGFQMMKKVKMIFYSVRSPDKPYDSYEFDYSRPIKPMTHRVFGAGAYKIRLVTDEGVLLNPSNNFSMSYSVDEF